MTPRDLNEEERAELTEHLLLLGWVYARATAGLGTTEPYKTAMVQAGTERIVDQASLTPAAQYYQENRKEIHLHWLRILKGLDAAVTHAADRLAGLAADEGANYSELGASWNMTRQGARKKWRRVIDDRVGPEVGDRVRLTYGDGSSCEGTWEDTPNGPALRRDDGKLHTHVAGQVRRDVITRAGDSSAPDTAPNLQ